MWRDVNRLECPRLAVLIKKGWISEFPALLPRLLVCPLWRQWLYYCSLLTCSVRSVRSEDFSKTTGALMHSNMLHYNDNCHQQYEMEAVEWLSVCLYPTVNYPVKVTNRINASPSTVPFLPSPTSALANKRGATSNLRQWCRWSVQYVIHLLHH